MAIIPEDGLTLNASSDTSKRKNGAGRSDKNVFAGEELAALNESPATPYDPHAHRNIEHPTTNGETLIHILKGSLGTGILAMPDAFRNSGLLVGTIGTILIGILCTYCFLVLIRCQYEICKRIRKPLINYPDTMKYALQQGPPYLRFAAGLSMPIVDGFLIVYQLGICCVYTVFIGVSIQEFVKGLGYEMEARTYMLIILPLLIAITLIRNLKLLAPFSQAANFAMFLGLGILLYYIFQNFPSINSDKLVGPPMRYTLFIGTTLFALEAVGVFLALENNMKTPKSFGGATGVLSQGMTIVTILYVLMGFVGYVRYGECVRGSITLNIPQGDFLAQLTKLIFAFAIYITYALQCYVPVDIIWSSYMKESFAKRANSLTYQYLLRIVCVVITFLLAIAIPYLSLFISLFGALCLSMLGIAFPALIEICILYPNNYGTLKYILFKNIFIILIGVFAGALGTGLAVNDIVKAINGIKSANNCTESCGLDEYVKNPSSNGYALCSCLNFRPDVSFLVQLSQFSSRCLDFRLEFSAGCLIFCPAVSIFV
ncbi:hypothetical protein V9T40_008642 [Parthenolecanium corni]|uniref:Amino acid transporter transmembrane domain-containing protein n=1 Tax=Parthenolecanium corni TaxID=536013 RepID=A0AAN9TQU4_9HEMI